MFNTQCCTRITHRNVMLIILNSKLRSQLHLFGRVPVKKRNHVVAYILNKYQIRD